MCAKFKKQQAQSIRAEGQRDRGGVEAPGADSRALQQFSPPSQLPDLATSTTGMCLFSTSGLYDGASPAAGPLDKEGSALTSSWKGVSIGSRSNNPSAQDLGHSERLREECGRGL